MGWGVELGWREAKGKKKRKKKKGGRKPQEAVALADLKAELSTISIGDSQAQGQGEEVMEGVVEGEGGDGSKGLAFPGGKGEGAAPQPSPASLSVGPAFDAHFHLDRLMGKEKGKLSVDSIYKMDVSPRDRIDLKGRCMFFCDPEHYPSAEDLRKIREHPGFWVAVGIHPKHAGKVGDAQVRRLKQLVANPGVAAMGEIGLDFTAGSLAPVPWQERLFGECLTVAPRDKPIVLHICPVDLVRALVTGVVEEGNPLGSGGAMEILPHGIRLGAAGLWKYYGRESAGERRGCGNTTEGNPLGSGGVLEIPLMGFGNGGSLNGIDTPE